MSPHQLKRLFPTASASTLAANAGDYGSGRPSGEPTLLAKAPEPTKQADTPKSLGKRRRQMNKTERAFSLLLEADKHNGNRLQGWHYEGMTLRWGTLDPISYTADFLVFDLSGIRLIEVKGAKLWKDTSQKFKAARNQWPQFRFEMWQKQKDGWKQLY